MDWEENGVKWTNGCIEQALDVAADAILRRARVLEAHDADVAERLRVLVLNLDPDLCLRPEEKGQSA